MDNETNTIFKLAAFGVVVGVLIIGGCMAGMPRYRVYSQRLAGEAELAKAEFSKKVLVQEAQAKMDSARLYADAEIERAKGVAQANQIIGDSLKGNEAYLRYLWINNLTVAEGKGQVIYVPTEAGLPLLEAGRGTK